MQTHAGSFFGVSGDSLAIVKNACRIITWKRSVRLSPFIKALYILTVL